MKIQTACSKQANPVDAVKELAQQLSGFDFNALIFFASDKYDFAELGNELNAAFEGKTVFGCSSHAEFNNGAFAKDSITAMAFAKDCVSDIKVEVLEHASTALDLDGVAKGFEDYFHVKMSDLSFREYIGIMLTDGLCGAEEFIIECIGELTNVFFVGGSAADQLTFKGTYLFANGKVYQDASVLALLKVPSGFDIIKTQSVQKTDKILTVTKSDPLKRLIYEFNGRPAVEYLAEVLGVAQGDLQASFFGNPLGLVIGNDIFIRSLRAVEANGAIAAFCAVADGTELVLLKTRDMVEDTRKALLDKEHKLGSISGILNFNCVLRTLQLEQENSVDNFCSIFSKYPTCGFSTYGEIYLGHINQTATMLVFK